MWLKKETWQVNHKIHKPTKDRQNIPLDKNAIPAEVHHWKKSFLEGVAGISDRSTKAAEVYVINEKMVGDLRHGMIARMVVAALQF